MLTSKLVLVSGKGGTGKSAVTAGLALARARRGERVLAVDLGDGLGLHEHLGTGVLDYEARKVRPGVFALRMERAAALDEYLKTQLRVPSNAPTGAVTSALSVLVDTAPGVREIISIGKPVYEVWGGEWDAVLVDCPSLGQFQSYLRAPAAITDLVPTGNVRRQAGRLSDTISDPETTAIVLVAHPEELAVNEAEEARSLIRAEGVGPEPAMVLNRVVVDNGVDDELARSAPAGPLREAAVHQVQIRAHQQTWRTAMVASYEFPFFIGVHTPREIAEKLADEVER